MQYINDRDYEYIKNKYHDTNKPYDSFRRFIRHDEIFAEDTGMEYFAMKDAFIANDEKISHLSHHIRKATAFAFVLDRYIAEIRMGRGALRCGVRCDVRHQQNGDSARI